MIKIIIIYLGNSGNPPSRVVGGSMTREVIWVGIIIEQQSLFSGVFFVHCGFWFD